MNEVRTEIELRKECSAIANKMISQNKYNIKHVDPIQNWMNVNQQMGNSNPIKRHNQMPPLMNNFSTAFES
jgi:hypothetical protein